MVDLAEARARVEDLFPETVDRLLAFLRIPSVNAEEDHRLDVAHAAKFVGEWCEELGLETRIAVSPKPDGKPGAPAVIARTTPVEGWPTVLLYAHHDVQPVTGQVGWRNDPFDPVIEGADRANGVLGRVVARGTADNKGGVVAHLGAIRAIGEDRKVNLIVLIEGEEEVGSPSMPALLERFGSELCADVAIIIDGNMWRVDVPMMTASMRGLLVGDITVSAFRTGLHSGGYGGPVLDSNVLAARLISSFHDAKGEVAVKGLDTGVKQQSFGVAISAEEFRKDATLLEDTELTESSALISEQLWVKPSISVIGIDATPTAAAAGVLEPSCTFRVSLRLPPDLTPAEAEAALREHLAENRPFGAKVEFTVKQQAKGYLLDLESEQTALLRSVLDETWNTQSVAAGVGGTVPLLHFLSEKYPEVTLMKVGTGDPDSKPHGENESASLDLLQNLIVALTLYLDRVGN